MAAVSVELRGVVKRFGPVTAVDNVDLMIQPGELLALLGPSGSGKTTILRIIAGLATPTSGEVYIGGKLVNDVPVHKRGLGMVAQNYALFPHMTVFENVAFGLKMRKMGREETAERVGQALETVRLSGFEARFPNQLSGGQQQRVALARCIAVRATVLLLDEPLGALDKKLRETMQLELRWMHRKLGITTIFVTHDQEEALTLADRIVVMNHGKIEQVGTPKEIYETPGTRFVSEFIGMSNFLSGRVLRHAVGGVVVETDRGLVLVLPSAADYPAIGSQMAVAVRPEKITASLCRQEQDGNNCEGEVTAAVYLGNVTHYYVCTVEGHELVVYVQNTDVSDGDGAFQVGDRVFLHWRPEANRAI